MIRNNPDGDYPRIDKTAYIDPAAILIGKIEIGKNVFVGPGAIIRADEPDSQITIRENCNVQDRVVIHAIEQSDVLIEENTSITHGSIIHGPCKIGKGCFIGFGSVVFNAKIGNGVIVKNACCVDGVDILPERVVESGQVITKPEDLRLLSMVDKNTRGFRDNVIRANLYLVKGYKRRI
ncbi:MAG: carbonate dehydratase [bacterium]